MVYGHDEDGEVFLGRNISQSRGYSEAVAFEIDSEVRSIIDSAYKKATEILSKNMDKLMFIAEYLLEHEKMDQNEFLSLMEKGFVELKEEVVSASENAEATVEAQEPTEQKEENE